jgi:glycosyltransferase involved in cell wall biosynthesis
VIAYGRGGALETVVDGVTGIFFEEQTVESLLDALLELESRELDPSACRRNAERFGGDEFRDRILETVRRQLSDGGAEAPPLRPARVVP